VNYSNLTNLISSQFFKCSFLFKSLIFIFFSNNAYADDIQCVLASMKVHDTSNLESTYELIQSMDKLASSDIDKKILSFEKLNRAIALADEVESQISTLRNEYEPLCAGNKTIDITKAFVIPFSQIELNNPNYYKETNHTPVYGFKGIGDAWDYISARLVDFRKHIPHLQEKITQLQQNKEIKSSQNVSTGKTLDKILQERLNKKREIQSNLATTTEQNGKLETKITSVESKTDKTKTSQTTPSTQNHKQTDLQKDSLIETTSKSSLVSDGYLQEGSIYCLSESELQEQIKGGDKNLCNSCFKTTKDESISIIQSGLFTGLSVVRTISSDEKIHVETTSIVTD